MKKRAFIVLLIILVLLLTYFIGTGFMKNTSAYINDFSVSEDGSEITMNVGVSSSMGYIREVSIYQQEGGKLYIDCYSAFGGLNGSIGAKSVFTLPLDKDTTIIAIYLISNPEPLKTPAFSAFSGPRPCPFPLFFPSREKIRESFFIRLLPLCRVALRKSAWLLLWRGRKCSSWYLHLRVREVPAHPWVQLRWIRGCWYMYVSTDGNGSHPYCPASSGMSGTRC